MAELIRQRIAENLRRLRLTRIRDILDPILEQAQEKSTSYLEVLDQLLTEEVASKEDRRFNSALRLAGLPFEKTIDQYDFAFNPLLDKRSVMNLFDLEFIKQNENVIFLGPPGVGKSHLAVSLAIKAAQYGQSIYCTTMADLMKKLKKDPAQNQKINGKRSYCRNDLVIVDELGYKPISRKDVHLFFQFVCSRYEKSSTIITSNKSFTEWEELFGDPVIATAILDRLLHHCRVISVPGDSYRLKEFQLRKEKESKDKEVASVKDR